MRATTFFPSLLVVAAGVALKSICSATAGDLRALLSAQGITTTDADFHGFAELDFKLPEEGAACKIVSPKKPAAGTPWVWRARFWDHQPAFDLAMLEHGYHLVYCDVVELYGAPKAVARWDKFYSLVTEKLQFGPKPVLEGMSRGGLYIFNWAKANPTKVTAIYGDNPVCDIRYWPVGRPGPQGKECLAAYGITEAQLADFKGSPIDGLEPLALAKVPVFLVLGAKDEIVLLSQNADVLETRYKALGGSVTRWVKPEGKHHPHGLDPVKPLVDAVLAVAK